LSSIRILVVEDYEPLRRFVRSTVAKRPELQVVCEVSDGLEAVFKAAELQPDLIVLDIGLPSLNGIEVARRIRRLAPASRILFLTQESSADVAREALSVGALGYVAKAQAGRELLPALEAVCQGKQFVSSGLSGSDFIHAVDLRDPADFGPGRALPSLVPEKAEIPCRHEARFYSDDASLLVGFASFVETALKAGNVAIAIATASHQHRLFQCLQERDLNIGAAIERKRYVPLDVGDLLAAFMADDLPDPVRFWKSTSDFMVAVAKAARADSQRVAMCGEIAPTLWAKGQANAAIWIEHVWDEIVRACDVDLLCGYVLNSFQKERESHIYDRICAEHSAVWPH